MVPKRLSGPAAGARKYDLLTALAVAGLAGPPAFATSMTRLIALITARYNWRLDEVSIGQEELARLWSVDLRTVKREVKRLREHGLLVVKRPGVRGRVASYGLDHARIEALTEACWPLVGPDFQDRMAAGRGGAPGDTPQSTVVPFPGAGAVPEEPASPWGRTRAILKAADASRYAAWFAPLAADAGPPGTLILRAPTPFHANYVTTHLAGEIWRALEQAGAGVRDLTIAGP